jgi:hypothetical protein
VAETLLRAGGRLPVEIERARFLEYLCLRLSTTRRNRAVWLNG